MASVNKLRLDIDNTKRELKNIRQEILKQKANMKAETEKIKFLFYPTTPETTPVIEEKSIYSVTPIGYISTCFKFKNGIPRQPSLCPTAKATLKIEKSVFTNPEHSLIGLNEFSHIWILFIFHENDNTTIKAKVHPPRLNGKSVGVFSTRSPHRPSALGLSLTKLEKVEGDTLHLSGIDLLDGTPVVDIKPYIPVYDNPLFQSEISATDSEETKKCDSYFSGQSASCDSDKLNEKVLNTEALSKESKTVAIFESKVPDYLSKPPQKLEVLFSNRALNDLENLDSLKTHDKDNKPDLSRYDHNKTKQAITEVLQNDPRSVYRKEKCLDKLYYFHINDLHITCWFDDSIAEVLRIKLPTGSMKIEGKNI